MVQRIWRMRWCRRDGAEETVQNKWCIRDGAEEMQGAEEMVQRRRGCIRDDVLITNKNAFVWHEIVFLGPVLKSWGNLGWFGLSSWSSCPCMRIYKHWTIAWLYMECMGDLYKLNSSLTSNGYKITGDDITSWARFFTMSAIITSKVSPAWSMQITEV